MTEQDISRRMSIIQNIHGFCDKYELTYIPYKDNEINMVNILSDLSLRNMMKSNTCVSTVIYFPNNKRCVGFFTKEQMSDIKSIGIGCKINPNDE